MTLRALRLLALILTLAVPAQGIAACGGWAATSQARMSCCADTCPMHEGSHAGAVHAGTPADADRCCAASEAHDPSPTPPLTATCAAPTLGPVQVLARLEPSTPRLHPHAWHEPTPTPAAGIARHLLLATLLV